METDFTLEALLPMEPSKGPPLPRFLEIYWPWYNSQEEPPLEKGFELSIRNLPEGTYWWLPSIYEPFGGATLLTSESWVFTEPLIHSIYGEGVGELYGIGAFNEAQEQLAYFDMRGTLVYEGKSYVFDCATGELSEGGS